MLGELADGLPVSRPAVSQHLRVLKDARLVTAHREGNRNVYSIDPTGVEQLRAYVDRFWTTALDRYQKAAEKRGRRS